MIYLDNNATTAPLPEVRAAMLPYLTNQYANPSSVHRFGQESRQAVEHARRKVSALIRCEPRELIFTSGGTESDNAAIHGLLAAHPHKKTILTSAVEHSAIREPLQHLVKNGYKVIEIPVDRAGKLDMDQLTAHLANPDLAFATIMYANNETGVLFDIPAIAALTKKHNIPLHVDAIQAVGKIPIDLKTTHAGIDLLSLSAHKFHGPKGTGALFVRRNVRWQPLLRGGPQERDRRGGTENVPAIVGMAAAAELAQAHLADPENTRHIAQLRDQLEQKILAQIPDTHINGNSGEGGRVPNTTNIAFANLEAEAILLLLSEQDICASAGAACSSGSLEPSHVLNAMHLPDPLAHGSLRFSLSRLTTQQDIDTILAALPPLIARLRATLPIASQRP